MYAHTRKQVGGRFGTEPMSYRFTPPEGRDSQTLHQVLARRVEQRGDAPWIAGEERSWTYRDIDSMSSRIANGLAAHGIGKGETVLAMLPDCVEFIAAWCGLAKLGAVQVPVNTHLRGAALAERIASRAPVAVQLHKAMLDAALEGSLEGALNFETEALVQTAMTRDNLEGARAFFEKREPRFTGE